MDVIDEGEVVATYPISTSKNGPGEKIESERTPRGDLVVHAMLGEGLPEGAVFVGRRPTGEVCTRERFRAEPDGDWILTRILWLGGLETGRNRGGNVDTLRRTIYIHGCPDEIPMGIPTSRGCIRMRNSDVVDLFDRVEVGTLVRVEE